MKSWFCSICYHSLSNGKQGDIVSRTTVRALIGRLSESVPGTSIAAVGFGLALHAYEMRRMSSFFSVAPGDSAALIPGVSSLAALIALALVYRSRPKFRLHRHPWIGFGLAGILTLSLLLSSGFLFPLPREASIAADAVHHMGELLLLLCWVEVLLTLPSRSFATLTALAMLVLSLLNGFSGLLKQNAVLALIALVPLLSMACLYWFKDKRDSFDTALAQTGRPNVAHGVDTTLLPRENSRSARCSAALLFLAPLVGYPFIFGHIHYSWIPFQDGSQTSLAIQLAAAAGTALAALMLLALTAHFWGRRKIDLYSLIILPVVGITLYLTGILHGPWVFLYVVPLNICQKMVLFLAMLTPYLIPSRKSPLSTWCVAFTLYTLGKTLSTSVSSELDGGLYALFVIAFIIVLTTASIAGVVIDDNTVARERQKSEDHDDAAPAGEALEHVEAPEGKDAVAQAAPAYEDIARAYRLTRREGEILELLAQGMTAAAIAEELVVSTSTAKTHMRNIYQKLGIHTQSELLLLVHRKD